MKIERLILENFRGIGKTLELPLEPDLTVLAGVNGSGKSTILDALAILLSWVVARTRRAGGSGMPISELSIHNSAGYARIRAETCAPDSLHWQFVKSKKGHAQPAFASELEELSKYTKSIQQRISDTKEKCNIPLFAYYPVNRGVLDIPLRIRQYHEFGLLEAWDGSLAGAANFRDFFEWFRNREDLENETRIRSLLERWRGEPHDLTPDFIATVTAKLGPEYLRGHREDLVADQQLQAVRCALQAFLPEFKEFSVRRSPLRMVVNKQGNEIRIDQLSDGEKCLIALVGDLARRLAIANPQRANPLEGEGILLIDEIDLHIHPAWQRKILADLKRTFPGCQFVVSTHSPQVLGEAEPRQIRLLSQDEKQGFTYSIPSQSKGLSSNDILDELMRPGGETLTRNDEIQQQLDKLSHLIDREQFEDARALIEKLKQELHGDRPELIGAESLLFMLDTDGKQ